MLYFNEQRALQAYDDILLGGTGEAQVNLERHVVKEPEPPVPATPTPGTPTPGTPTPASPVPPAGAPPPDPTPTG
ncbi:hypothetical protein GCM10027615_30440 [Plantactinospora veratri]